MLYFVCTLLGPLFFLGGSVCFYPALNSDGRFPGYAFGAWCFVLGDCFFCGCAFYDARDFLRRFLCCWCCRPRAGAPPPPRVPPVEAVATVLSLVGNVLFMPGCILYIPAIEQLRLGNNLFINGCGLFVAAALLDLLRVVRALAVQPLRVMLIDPGSGHEPCGALPPLTPPHPPRAGSAWALAWALDREALLCRLTSAGGAVLFAVGAVISQPYVTVLVSNPSALAAGAATFWVVGSLLFVASALYAYVSAQRSSTSASATAGEDSSRVASAT
jgi:hypothetical protein